MEQALPQIILLAIVAALVALLGRNRKIGYGWSFLLCLFLSPIIGLIFILSSKKTNATEFVEIKKEETLNK